MYIIQNADEIITARGVDLSVTLCGARWRAGSAPTYLQFETHDVICHFSAKYPKNVALAFWCSHQIHLNASSIIYWIMQFCLTHF